MKQFSLKNYNAEGSWFEHYYKFTPNNPVDSTPEHITYQIKPFIPDYITTIINFGCANGRDFIPFQEDYNLVGFDLVKGDYIEWTCDTTNLTYYQCSMEDFMDSVDIEDLSTSLVYTNVSLFYLQDKQEQFITHILNKKCKNMVFQEYKNSSHGYFQPGKHKNLFKEKQFNREDVTGFIYLDNIKA